MTRIGKLMVAALAMLMLALALGCGDAPNQPGDTGGDDKSRNELTR